MNEMVHITFGRTVIAVRRDLAAPADPVLRGQLEAKLEEYRQRLKVTELTPHREASTNYKIWVLQQLLDLGALDFLLLKAAVAKDATNQTLAIAYLAYAWKVIENYCYNNGTQNRGGTGLPADAAPSYSQPSGPLQPSESLAPPVAPGGAQQRSRIPFVLDEEVSERVEEQPVA